MRNRTEDQIVLALIRHGETQANRERRYLGKTDESLSESGIAALRLYKKQKIYPDVQYLFTSPMKRCIETAQILYPELTPHIIPEWKEMDFGCFEYKNYEDLKGDIRYQRWIDSGGTLAFPGGESRETFIARCEKGFLRMCRELPGADGGNAGEMDADKLDMGERERGKNIRVGLIVHGGTIMALLSTHGRGEYFSYQTANGEGYLCKMKGWGNGAKIMAAGKICH